MKKVLPLLLWVLLAFVGCQRGPVMYEMAEKPSQVVANAEKFVKQTEKRAKHYSEEDWQVAVQQFVAMSKNYFENVSFLTEEEQMRFDNARVKFMGAITDSGNMEVAKQVKEEYSKIFR
jgi:hypothetical protein